MAVTVLAVVEAALLVFGALSAGRAARWLSAKGDAKVVMMASLATWFILFGMVPFLVFALFATKVGPQTSGVGSLDTFVLNLIPFALAASPVIGLVEGFRLSRAITGT